MFDFLKRKQPHQKKQSAAQDDLASALREVLGGGATLSGVSVSENSALKFAAFYRCIWLLSTMIGQLPLNIYRKLPEGGTVKIDFTNVGQQNREIESLAQLMVYPNIRHTPADIQQKTGMSLLLHGNMYFIKSISNNRVLEILPLDAARMEVKELDNYRLEYHYISKQTGRVIVYNSDQIIHIRSPLSDNIKGMSVLQHCRESLGYALAQDQHGARSYKNGLNTNMVLTTNSALSDEVRKQLKQEISAYSGADNAGKIPLFESGLKLDSVGMSFADAQFLEGREFSVLEMARWFGIPQHLLFVKGGPSNWGTGLSEQTRGLVVYTLMPWLVNIEQSMTRDLLRRNQIFEGYFFKFDADALLRGSLKERTESYQRMTGGRGWMLVNEIRKTENHPPIDGGDDLPPPQSTAMPEMPTPPAQSGAGETETEDET